MNFQWTPSIREYDATKAMFTAGYECVNNIVTAGSASQVTVRACTLAHNRSVREIQIWLARKRSLGAVSTHFLFRHRNRSNALSGGRIPVTMCQESPLTIVNESIIGAY